MKTASLAWFYMGEDSIISRLAQETVPVWRALEGYDHQILLRHETDIGPLELSKAAEKRADVLLPPTREHLVEELNSLAEKQYLTDIYIFSHGSDDRFLASKGTYGDNTHITQEFLEANVKGPLNIRMVWMGICHGASMNDCWRNLGARVTAGTQHVNFYPTRFKRFAKLWDKGKRFKDCIEGSDSKGLHVPVHLYVQADAVASRRQWGGLPLGRTVLGSHPRVKDYFLHRWFDEDEWLEGQSGRANMNNASKYIIEGDGSITKRTTF